MDDIHAKAALELYGEVTRETRAKAKAIGFRAMYGAGDIPLARVAGCYPLPALPHVK